VLDDVLRLDKILSTDGGVLIIDQICLVIPDPRRFPDAHYEQKLKPPTKRISAAACCQTVPVAMIMSDSVRFPSLRLSTLGT
jgi:hypothetical protein